MRLKAQIKKLRQLAKLLRKVNHTRTQRNKKIPKRQPYICLTPQQEEINQKILAKECRQRQAIHTKQVLPK